jgi:hypothetical protein
VANKIELGARERNPPPAPANSDSKFRNHAIDAALTVSLLSSAGKSSSDLRQFTASNLANQRKEDVSSERSEAKIDKKIHNTEQQRSDLIADKKAALDERNDVIKSEYGSVQNYNNSMNAPKIEQQRSELVTGKKRISAERNVLLCKGQFFCIGKTSVVKFANSSINTGFTAFHGSKGGNNSTVRIIGETT